jgi:hypothetical protein
LPWSSKNTVDKLCPSFSESGSVVACEPLEGYPLNVITESEGGAITLTQCGKNIFNYKKYKFTDYMITHAGGAYQQSSGFSATEDYIPVSHLRGQTISLNHPPIDKTTTTTSGLAFYNDKMVYISGSPTSTHVVPNNAAYMRFTVPREYANATQVQIELGSVVTEHEPYREIKYTADASGAEHEWSGVNAIEGVNTIWSSLGTTTVEGKSDPVKIIEKLTNAIISLGGNV